MRRDDPGNGEDALAAARPLGFNVTLRHPGQLLCFGGGAKKTAPLCESVSKTQTVSQSDCFVTHWAVEMRFLHWWSSF